MLDCARRTGVIGLLGETRPLSGVNVGQDKVGRYCCQYFVFDTLCSIALIAHMVLGAQAHRRPRRALP